MPSATIPAYNAEATIGETVRALREGGKLSEVVVVDDGSQDGTAQAAAAAGADRVVRLGRNRGKGAALLAGAAAATGERLLLVDADLGESARHAPRLLDLAPDGAAMSVAVFPRRPGGGGLGLARRLAWATIRLLSGLRVAAPMSGQRALPRSLLQHIGAAPRFGVEVGLTVEAAHLGLPVVEAALPLEHQHTGRTLRGFRHRARQFRDVLWVLLLIGYGVGWPALGRGRVWARLALWLGALGALGWGAHTLSPGVGRATAAAAGLGVVLWLPCLWLSAVWLGVRRRNYLGRRVPAAAGLVVVVAAAPALWWWGAPGPEGPAVCLVLVVLGAAGLLDDLLGDRGRARGLWGHARSLLRGRPTTGAAKALLGLLGGLGAGVLLHPGRPAAVVVDALLIALSANVVNLLDLRPGRALKGFAALGAAAAASPAAAAALAPVAAVALVSAPADLSGRAMMGDVGANALGGAAGVALAGALGPGWRAGAVAALAALHLLCERVSLTEVIARSGLLRALDRLGTEHLAPYPPAKGAQR